METLLNICNYLNLDDVIMFAELHSSVSFCGVFWNLMKKNEKNLQSNEELYHFYHKKCEKNQRKLNRIIHYSEMMVTTLKFKMRFQRERVRIETFLCLEKSRMGSVKCLSCHTYFCNISMLSYHLNMFYPLCELLALSI